MAHFSYSFQLFKIYFTFQPLFQLGFNFEFWILCVLKIWIYPLGRESTFSGLFGNWKKVKVLVSHVPHFQTPWTVAHQAPLYTVAQMVKSWPAMQETQVRSLGWEDSLEKWIATHSSILAWRIPGTEEPGSWGHKELDTTEQLI